MIRSIRPTLLLLPFALGASPVLMHCGGSDGGLEPIEAGSGVDSGSMQAPDAAPPSGDDASAPDAEMEAMATGDDSGPVQVSGDGGPPGMSAIPVPDGGAPSDPGYVSCNGAPCAVSAGYSCCVTAAGDGGAKEICNPPNSGCTGLTIFCNEAADCNGGVCCQQINGIAVAGSTSCTSAKTCPGLGTETFQTCRTDEECGAADAGGLRGGCIPQTCTNTLPKRTLPIEACAVSRGLGDTTGGPLISCAAN